jgi:hypothetical protein
MANCLEVIMSRQGKPLISKGGFIFQCCRKALNKNIWRCDNWEGSCNARLHTTDSAVRPELIKELGEHNHPPTLFDVT